MKTIEFDFCYWIVMHKENKTKLRRQNEVPSRPFKTNFKDLEWDSYRSNNRSFKSCWASHREEK
jgi:hypothetical protein